MAIFPISGVWQVGWWNSITSVRLIQVGNNLEMTISGTFTCRCLSTLNRGFRLIKVSFKVNKENKFGDFGFYPLNRGCPLNTGFNVQCLLRIVYVLSPLVAMCFVQWEVSSLKCIIFIDGG